jgi:hypothetical protein
MTIPKGKSKRRSRFPEGMTERKARTKATATATANTGVLRFAQDDGEKQATTTATATILLGSSPLGVSSLMRGG